METPTSPSSMEARLSALEYKLGIQAGASRKRTTTGASSEADVVSRLDAIQSVYDSRTNATFRETCGESAKLLRDLDAGTALTYQTHVGSSAPLYYRRQEVLASKDSLKEDMDQILKMIPLLLVGTSGSGGSTTGGAATTTLESGQAQPQGGGGGTNKSSKDGSGGSGAVVGGAGSGGGGNLLREDEVIHAPILNSTASISREDQRRLDVARMDISDLQQRTNHLAQRVDNLLKLYSTVVSSLSSKIVLADEGIALHEKK